MNIFWYSRRDLIRSIQNIKALFAVTNKEIDDLKSEIAALKSVVLYDDSVLDSDGSNLLDSDEGKVLGSIGSGNGN